MIEGGTIAALSTPPGRGGIAVIRISGEKTESALRKIIENVPGTITPRRVIHSFVLDSGKRIEECLYVFFQSPESYTGEDSAEISIHSNPFLAELILKLIFREGIREALPGEFTYRSFKNGKMDLIQAESINELINANSEYYARMKFGNLEGRLSGFLNELKNGLVALAVGVESIIEFQEDHLLEEFPFSPQIESAIEKIDEIVSGYRFAEILDKGIKIVIAGKTNAGKSSLFNTLLLEDRSITSARPGTTRDFIKEKIHSGGVPVELIDIAGISSGSEDDIERIGIKRSLEILQNTDAVIFLLDGSSEISDDDRLIYKIIKNKKKAVFINKSDQIRDGFRTAAKNEFADQTIHEISVLENRGIKKVHAFVSDVVNDIAANSSGINVNFRQKSLLLEVSDALKRAGTMMAEKSPDLVLISEEVRSALRNIGGLLGEVTDEDILGNIFSQFCIGK